jgi:acetamidase/formamidase
MAMHRFAPKIYHNVLGLLEPALTISPGDTVVTTTADAHGYDEHMNQVGRSPNPMTGPFYVAGAEPGDTLVVHLETASPNRDTGWTSSVFRPNVVEPLFVKDLPNKEYRIWNIDREKRTVRYMDPESAKVIVELPYSPMLGCIGTAPSEGQAISTLTCGSHGGNMDYGGITENVRIYFPVSVEGALLFLGDGHAGQSEGEISGTGVETSFSVQFHVELLKGKTISWPRGENSEYIFTIGNARPLERALQFAITEMLRWVRKDFGVDIDRAGMLLGQAVELDVGNIISPDCTMVCKMRRSYLKQ